MFLCVPLQIGRNYHCWESLHTCGLSDVSWWRFVDTTSRSGHYIASGDGFQIKRMPL